VFGEHLATQAYVNMTKYLFFQQVAKFVFNVSILLFSQVPTLQCKQTQTSLKKCNSGLGFWSPRNNLFSDPLRNRIPCLGRDLYYGSYWLKRL